MTDNVGQSRLESGQAEYDAGSEKLAAAKAQYAAGQAQLEQGKADYAAGQEKLAAAKEEYAAGQAQLAKIQPVYDAVHPAYQRYLDRQAEYDAAVASGDLAKAALLWPGICITLFAAGALAFAGVCLGHRSGKAVAWCTALAAILSVGCLIAMLAAGHGALRTLCLCAALALLVLAFVAAGFTLRQRAQRAQ